jgi:hypothetical protein
LTVQFIQGLEKFPIQYWNNPGEKINLELKELNIASFFFKSAQKDTKNDRPAKLQEIQPTVQNEKQVSTLDSIFRQMLQANQVNTEGDLTSPFCTGLNLVDDDD